MISRLYENKIGVLFVVLLLLIGIRILIFQLLQTQLVEPKSSGILGPLLMQIYKMPWVSFAASTVILLFEGLLLNRISLDFNILERPGYSILFFYTLLSSSFIGGYALNHIHIGLFFVLWGIFFLYRFIRESFQKSQLFVAAFFMGVSAICVAEFYWSIILLVGSVLFFKPIKAADVAVIVFGLFMPYYLVSSVGYLTSASIDFMTAWKIWIVKYETVQFRWLSNGWDLLLILSFSLIAVFGLMKFYGNYYRYNVETRRSKLAMSVISGYLILVFVFRATEYPIYFTALVVPMTLYLSNYFQGDKLKFWKNLTAIVLLSYWAWNLFHQLSLKGLF